MMAPEASSAYDADPTMRPQDETDPQCGWHRGSDSRTTDVTGGKGVARYIWSFIIISERHHERHHDAWAIRIAFQFRSSSYALFILKGAAAVAATNKPVSLYLGSRCHALRARARGIAELHGDAGASMSFLHTRDIVLGRICCPHGRAEQSRADRSGIL